MTAPVEQPALRPNAGPPVTVYWRPGCGFCHILRRELDRAGIERTEVNIWDDPDAAAVVRSHARGNETVPTVLVGGVALVNPNAPEVIAARDRQTGAPRAALTARATPPSGPRESPWSGVVWSGAANTVWAVLAMVNPTTTYHLAPVVALLAWPVIARSRRTGGGWRAGLIAAGGATVLVALTAGLLGSRGALAGPSLIGPNATVETAVLSAVAALAALALARPRPQVEATLRDAAEEDPTGDATVVEPGSPE